MRRNRGGIRRRPAKCPECGHIFRIQYRPDVRRFRAPTQRCPECGHVGRRSSFPRPTMEDYDEFHGLDDQDTDGELE